VTRPGLAVTAIVLAAIGGCSPGPKTIHFDQPLPSCDAFPSVVSGLGMPSPGPGPQAITTASPVGFDCSFAPPDGTKPPAVGYAGILVLRPNTEPYEGKSLQRWGAGFAADTTCEGTPSDNAVLPLGSACYALRSEHTGSATVSTFTKGAGIRVDLQWTDLDAPPEQLHIDTVNRANALAQAVIGKL
jgi:hypothetical protein